MQPAMNQDPVPYRGRRRKHRQWIKWMNRVVLAVGYLFIAYELVRGIVYLLILWEEMS